MLRMLLLICVLPSLIYGITSKEALQYLKEGNQRFIDNKMVVENVIKQRMKSREGQAPYVTILCCSDSRVPPEIVFDESLGQLFIVRVMGNVIGQESLATIEYGVSVLKTPLLVVMGHEDCGAVEAVLKGIKPLPTNIQETLRSIIKPVEEAKRLSNNPKEQLHIAIIENAQHQLKVALNQSAILRRAIENKSLETVVGIYCFETGKVSFIPQETTSQASPDQSESRAVGSIK